MSSDPPDKPPESPEPQSGAPPPKNLDNDEKVESFVNVFVNLLLITLAVGAIAFGGCYILALGH